MTSHVFDIGNRRQLFIDERFIEHSQGIRLRMNPPVQHPDPVLVPDRPWESNGIGAYNTVMLEADGRFRLWYDAGVKGGLPAEGARRLGYARVSATQHRDEAAEGEGRKKYRSVGRVTSTDFRTWSDLEIVFEADKADLTMPVPHQADSITPNIDFYTSCAMKYEWAEEVYLIMPSAYYHWGEEQYPATMDVQLLTSRDGIAWKRAGDREPFLRQGMDGSSTSGMIFANPWLLPIGDELWLYYSGTLRSHRRPSSEAEEDGFARRTGIFRASMRRDGFISADAGYAGGEFTTPLVTFAGDRLELNCDGSAGGWLQVEMLDAEGRPIPGYSLAECDDVRGNGLSKTVAWKGDADVSFLSGQPVRLRFVMRGMKLFALQFCNS